MAESLNEQMWNQSSKTDETNARVSRRPRAGTSSGHDKTIRIAR